MNIDFDPHKSRRNDVERGLPFTAVEHFEWESALLWEDDRKAYPEVRYVALGKIGQRVHVSVLYADRRWDSSH